MVLLLCLLAGDVPALDSTNPDPALYRDDRQGHALAGAVVGSVGRVAVDRLRPSWSWWQKDLAAIATAAAVGIAREAIDANRPGHSSEIGDAMATAVGGSVGALAVELVWRF